MLTNPGHTLDKITLSVLLSLHSGNKGEGEKAIQLWVLFRQWVMQKLLNKTNNACRQKTWKKMSLTRALLLLFSTEEISQCYINNLKVNADLTIRGSFKLSIISSL